MADSSMDTTRRLELRAISRMRSTSALACIAIVVGVVLIIEAYANARHDIGSRHFTIFWCGYLLAMLAVLAFNIIHSSRKISAGCMIAVGLITYLPKFLMSINGPVYLDEFAHVRQVDSLLRTGNIMPSNSYLPILKYFPGLAMLTSGVHEVTRLSVWHSGQVVIVAAHTASIFAVYGMARSFALSRRASFFGAFVFSLNPSFTYFDTQYAYESLGIALSFIAILGCLRARRSNGKRSTTVWTSVGVVSAIYCPLTHHVSAVFMLVGLALVAFLVPPQQGSSEHGRRAGWVVAGTGALATVVWFGSVARPTFAYLSPHLSGAWTQLLRIFSGSADTSSTTLGSSTVAPVQRTLFAGSLSPSYERLAGFTAPIIAFAIVAIALWALWRRHDRREWLSYGPYIVLSIAYFVSLPFALTEAGSESAHRSWSFTYLGLAVLSAYVVSNGRPPLAMLSRHRVRVTAELSMAVLISVVIVGNIASGENVYFRFPGPTLFASDTRSQTPQLRQLVKWIDVNLPLDLNVITDRFTGEAILADTTWNVPAPNQSAVFGIYRQGDRPSRVLRAELKAGDFTYFILDTRIMTQHPTQALFESYHGLASVIPAALLNMRGNPFATIVHREDWYVVYRLSS